MTKLVTIDKIVIRVAPFIRVKVSEPPVRPRVAGRSGPRADR